MRRRRRSLLTRARVLLRALLIRRAVRYAVIVYVCLRTLDALGTFLRCVARIVALAH
jgi:hypothetical protein